MLTSGCVQALIERAASLAAEIAQIKGQSKGDRTQSTGLQTKLEKTQQVTKAQSNGQEAKSNDQEAEGEECSIYKLPTLILLTKNEDQNWEEMTRFGARLVTIDPDGTSCVEIYLYADTSWGCR